ncbi:MAG: cytochrome c2 [Rhizobiaceae bacterium]|nr:cytochrome c2 [Rhizobiaceae bacterium]
MRVWSCFSTAALILGTAMVPALGQGHNDMIEDLPEGPGREAVFYTCTACHGVRIITQQGLSAERWDAPRDCRLPGSPLSLAPEGLHQPIPEEVRAHTQARHANHDF